MFDIVIPKNSTVVVSSDCPSYHGDIQNCVGILVEFYSSKESLTHYGIRIPGMTNTRSAKGVFWVPTSYVTKLESDVTNEEVKIKIEEEDFMFNNYKIAEVSFLDNPNCTCAFALYDEGIEEDDTVVVKTLHHGFSLAKIVSIKEKTALPYYRKSNTVRAGREVVCKVDFTNFLERKEAALRAIELKRQMDYKIESLKESAMYDMFAEKDPALKEMLEEYRSLVN